jgi:S-formylglutathione hydrolase FrmB
MSRPTVFALGFLLAGCVTVLTFAADPTTLPKTALKFEVRVAKDLEPAARDGRLLIVLAKDKDPEPRHAIGETGLDVPPVIGKDVKGLSAESVVVVDQTALVYPLEHLAKLPAGDYYVQAVFECNRDLQLVDAPGNLLSEPVKVTLDPAKGGTVKIELTRKEPADKLPDDSEYVKYVKIRSELLTKFHGRPMFVRAGVILPRDFDKDKDKKYPLRVHTGGFGTRFSEAGEMMTAEARFRKTWLDDDTPRMIFLHLDGAGPFGDPYQVNSANNGPYGDAVTQELIPYVEKQYRGIGRPHARFLDGASTGGWVSLALQVFYPDFFNGAWSHAPDPVDFRAFELIDIYEDKNVYVNKAGFDRPSARELNGDVRFTMRNEVLRERAIGRGDRWELSGFDWGSWNAAFGPRGGDGLPNPLWDGKTGKIDADVLDHWKKYDLRRVLEKDWETLGPKLRGKIRIWVGEADDYFLNNAVHLLDDFLQKAKPAYEGKISFAPGKGHSYTSIGEQAMMKEMAAAMAKK